MSRPEEYFLDDDACTAERAALLGHRVQSAMRSAKGAVADDELDHPFAFVATPCVPGAEARMLAALSVLALQAAGELAGPVPARTIQVACATLPRDDTLGGACAGLVATRLDRPDALEIETRHVLSAVATALIDDHPGIADWIPRHRDPTVRLRTPAGAPGRQDRCRRARARAVRATRVRTDADALIPMRSGNMLTTISTTQTAMYDSGAPSGHSASALAAALAARAKQVCRRYHPRARKQGRFWTVGDVHGTEGRSLDVRLLSRHPGVVDRCGDLIEPLRLNLGAATLGPEGVLLFSILVQNFPNCSVMPGDETI